MFKMIKYAQKLTDIATIKLILAAKKHDMSLR